MKKNRGKITIKSLMKSVILVLFLFSFIVCFGEEDSVVVNQVVDPICNNNSVCDTGETYFSCPSDCDSVGPLCNSNGICEPSLGETISTCPSDCQNVVVGGGGINPEIVQKGLEGEPIEIFNVEVSTGIGATTISWETNKPTSTTLIFGYGRGGSEEVYIDEFFVKKHSIRIDDLSFREEYYFRIFSEGVYGDNNFGYTELFIIRQSLPDSFGGDKVKEQKINHKISQNPQEVISSKTIDTSTKKLEHPIVPPTIGGVCEDDTCGFESFSQFWGDFRCTVENSFWFSFIKGYLWQLLIFIGIIFFIFIVFGKDKMKKNILSK